MSWLEHMNKGMQELDAEFKKQIQAVQQTAQQAQTQINQFMVTLKADAEKKVEDLDKVIQGKMEAYQGQVNQKLDAQQQTIAQQQQTIQNQQQQINNLINQNNNMANEINALKKKLKDWITAGQKIAG